MAPTTAAVLTPTTLAKEKTLKQGYIVDESNRPKVAYNEFSDDVPVISLAGIDDDSPGGRREKVVEAIAEACEEWGIFQLVDHGVDPELISEMTRLSKDFFALPDEEKLRFGMSPGKKGGFLISSHFPNEAVANWRELVVYYPYPVVRRDYSRWPDRPEGWRRVVEAYSEKLLGLSERMLEIVSESLGLERDAITTFSGEMTQNLVVNHYPKCPQPDLAIGLKRHTDPSTLTLLYQDKVGGLQATKDGANTWVAIRPIPNAFVMNLGDYTYYLSNGRFKSGDHRAVVNSDQTRMSVAVFMNPQPQAKVYPLRLRDGETPLLDEPVTYEEMVKRHGIKYVETVRLKKLAEEENWSTEELNHKLSQLD